MQGKRGYMPQSVSMEVLPSMDRDVFISTCPSQAVRVVFRMVFGK